MKSLAFLPALLALAFAAHAEVSPLRMRVEQVNKTDTEKSAKTQKRSLKVTVSNSAKQDFSGLKLKYTTFVRDMKNKDLLILDEGEKSADVKAMGNEIVETPTVTASSVEEHYEGKMGKGGKSSGKKVPASGYKMYGYGVQLFEGGKLVAEEFNPPSLKEEASKLVSVPKPTKKKK